MKETDNAFSLVEVVVALGVASFAIVGLMGLFTVGYQSSKESEENIEAANLASLLIAQRRASPSTPGFVIPPLSPPPANTITSPEPLYLKSDGTVTTDLRSARTHLKYQIASDGISADVYLLLTWPPQAKPAEAAGKYELYSKIVLP